MGCTCKLCLLAAYEEWMENSDDPEVHQLIAEIVNDEYQPQDIVNDMKDS
jgi:hypothetical protein